MSTLLASRARPGSSTAVRRVRAPVLPPPLAARRACCLGKLCLVTRNSGRPSVCPLPLWFAWFTLTSLWSQLCRRRPVSSPCLRCHSCVSETSLKVTVLTPPLFSPVLHLLTRDCSPESSPVRRGLPSAVRSPQSPLHKTEPA
jgi:hypothetical protein